ncbi:MAG: hypothetical protein Q7I92_00915, partial [Humidesulfovibrio sp.]|nr:hypothetical protein [Humidesulfovibrio sp.]
MKQIKINKVDAAIAHITSAIRLYFTDGPEASIHVLAATSLDIAEAFLKNTTFSVFTFNHAFANMDIRESNDLWKFLRDVQNDLKHADRNKENVITIKELHTEMLLFY